MVTIREVAEKAGVSIGTVSRVINNKSGVGERTRLHVLEISKEMGYTPPKRVPLATKRVTHLGLLIRPTENPLTSDPFYGGIFNGVERTCQENRINVYFSTLEIKNGRLLKWPSMISDERISGIVLLGALPYHIVKEIDDAVTYPIVLIDNCYPNCEWDSVMIENEHGAYSATNHLIDHGHRNIVMMSGPNHPSILERRDGYAKAMREYDLIPNIIKTKSPSPGDGLSPSDGETGILEILEQEPDTTAVFCSNDNQALGSLVKLQRMGYSVPKDMSIVGFDNIITVNFTSPPLTTIHVDRSSLGIIATQLLFNRIENPSRAIVKSIVGTELVQRDSVAPPRTHPLEPISGET